MALAMVLIFTATLMLLGAAVINYALNEKKIADYHALETKLLYIAESGIEAALSALTDHPELEHLTGTLGAGSFSVTIASLNDNNYTITSTGSLNGYQKTLRVTLVMEASEGEERQITRLEWHQPY